MSNARGGVGPARSAGLRPAASVLAVLLLLGALLLLQAPAAKASRAGDLDPTFGDGGRVVQPDSSHALAVAAAPGGKMVAAGCQGRQCRQTILVRYDPGGNLDKSFGDDGIALVDFDPSSTNMELAAAVSVQGSGTDHHIITAGEAEGRFALARFNSNGSLDTSFGGDGMVLGPPGSATALAFQGAYPNGKWVVAGRTTAGGNGGKDFRIARFDGRTGAVDPTFGSDPAEPGTVTVSFGAEAYAGADGVVVDAGGIVAVGYSGGVFPGDRILAAIGLTPDGAVDPNFGAAGQFTGPAGTFSSVLLHNDGGSTKLVAAGRVNNRLAVMRLNRNGSMDPTFGVSGVALGPEGRAASVAVQGTTFVAAGRTSPVEDWSTYHRAGAEARAILVARFTSVGEPDTDFGSEGHVITDMGEEVDEAAGVAVDASQGAPKIVVAGHSGQYAFRMAVVRYQGAAAVENVSLRLAMQATPDPVELGDNLVFRMNVANAGPDLAFVVRLRQAVPPNVDFISVDASQGICSHADRTVSCELGGLAAGKSATVSVLVTPTELGSLTSSANVSTSSTDSSPSDNAATVDTTVVPAEGLFSPATKMSQVNARPSATSLYGPQCRGIVQPQWCGKVLVVNASTSELYDPLTDRWSPPVPLKISHGTFHTLTPLADGKVLLAGGRDAPTRAEIYDPVSGTWTETAGPQVPREGHVAVSLADGRVLVAGGRGDQTTVARCTDGTSGAFASRRSAEIFDSKVSGGRWQTSPQMVTGRSATEGGTISATLLPNGDVLVVGGSKGDPWYNAGPSGNNPEACDGKGPLAPGEIFNPASGWRDTGGPEIGRNGHTATLLRNNTVLVTGGNTTIGDIITTPSAVVYDPKDTSSGWQGSWKNAGGVMLHPRTHHAAVLLGNGKVLVTGGMARPRRTLTYFPKTAELYDPATGRFKSAGVTTSRMDHIAIPIVPGSLGVCGSNCGKVLMAGGSSPPTPDILKAILANPFNPLDPGQPLTEPVDSADLYTTPPWIDSLLPSEGPVAGNTQVAVSGAGLAALSKVTFEGAAPLACGKKGEAKCWVDDEFPDIKIFAISPPHPVSGQVQMIVETLPGLLASDPFRYIADPLGPDLDGGTLGSGLGQNQQNTGPPTAAPPGTSALGQSPSVNASHSLGIQPPLPPGGVAPSTALQQGLQLSPQLGPQLAQNIQVGAASQAGLSVRAEPGVLAGPAIVSEEAPKPAPRISFSALEQRSLAAAWGGAMVFGAVVAVCMLQAGASAAGNRPAPGGAVGTSAASRRIAI